MSARRTMKPVASTVAALAAALLAGCGHLGPKAEQGAARAQAQPDVPAQVRAADGKALEDRGDVIALAQAPAADAAPPAVAPPWPDFVRDGELRALVQAALEHNRDLRVAALNVERAQGAVAAARAQMLPQVGIGGGVQRAPGALAREANTFSLGMPQASWEIDLFGRLAAGDEAARASLASSASGRRAAELTVVAQVLTTAIAVRADTQLIDLSRQTLAARREMLRLFTLREKAGYSSLLDLDAQKSLVAQAEASLAQAQRQWQQDRHALALLVGRPLDALADGRGALPVGHALGDVVLEPVAGGIDASALWARPDVVQAEQALAAAQANVRAARAALWPTLALTGQAGHIAPTLAALVSGGATFAYTAAASVVWSVFDGGRRQAGIDQADASRRIALAQYEKAMQSAFRDAADALAGLDGWQQQTRALTAQAEAAREMLRLTDLRTRQGAASLLEQLDARRSAFAAEQALVQARQAQLSARVAVWKAVVR